ncbi:hypothetical protein BH11ACT6_BH11ACT6_03730 [soil metagenome]
MTAIETGNEQEAAGSSGKFVLNQHKFPWFNELMATPGLDLSTKAVGAWVIFTGLNSSGRMNKSHKEIAKALSVSRGTVKNKLRDLVDEHFLRCESDRGDTNSYAFITVDARRRLLAAEDSSAAAAEVVNETATAPAQAPSVATAKAIRGDYDDDDDDDDDDDEHKGFINGMRYDEWLASFQWGDEESNRKIRAKLRSAAWMYTAVLPRKSTMEDIERWVDAEFQRAEREVAEAEANGETLQQHPMIDLIKLTSGGGNRLAKLAAAWLLESAGAE